MIGTELPGAWGAYASLAIVAVMFALFLRERFPPEVVAIGGAAVMIVLGLVPYDDAAAVLSNSAPWTIAFMFIIMGGLIRTGALDMLSQAVARHADTRPVLTLVALFAFVVLASAIMNNTPVVAVMIPIFIQVAGRIGLSPSKLLIPLSYFTVMGGMITLLGTSTNLLVDGVVQERGMQPFGIFEIAPVGIAVTLAGAAFIALIGHRLLPDRNSMAALLNPRRDMKYFTEVAIPHGSSLVGQPLADVPIFRRDAVRVVDLLRQHASLRGRLDGAVLEAGDRVVLRTEMADLLEMQESKDLQRMDRLSSVETTTVEVLISPGARLVGRRLGQIHLRRRYGV